MCDPCLTIKIFSGILVLSIISCVAFPFSYIFISEIRLSSGRETGWLDMKIGRAIEWERMWFVFSDGVLYYSKDIRTDMDDASVSKVPMDRVISLRTDVSVMPLNASDILVILR
jgi:hypothetical protein